MLIKFARESFLKKFPLQCIPQLILVRDFVFSKKIFLKLIKVLIQLSILNYICVKNRRIWHYIHKKLIKSRIKEKLVNGHLIESNFASENTKFGK